MLLCGVLGPSASHIVDEYEFESLADFESALAGMSGPQFKRHSEALAPFIVPGSQHWVVYRVLDEPPGVSVVIRPAGVPDAPWLATLAERTFRETYSPHNAPENMERYVAEHFAPALQAAELADPGLVTLVAEVAGQAAGYTQLGHGAAPACVTGAAPLEVIRFYVDRPWHGQGLAQTLMRAAADHARAAGARTLWLGVWERNPRAIAFYRKVGFVEVGTHTFVLGADHQRDLVLARPLD